MKEVFGSWAPLLGNEITKEYAQEISKSISARKKNVFEEFKSNSDYFEHFKKVDLSNVKCIVQVEYAQFDPSILYEIEKQIHNGLNLDLTSNSSYDCLYEKGILILPRYCSWGISRFEKTPHEEWKVLSDSFIKIICDKYTGVISIYDKELLKELEQKFPKPIYIDDENRWAKIDFLATPSINWK